MLRIPAFVNNIDSVLAQQKLSPIMLDYAFREICCKGDFVTAQQLLCDHPNINISVCADSTFRYVCEYGHLNIAQWLLSVNPNIDVSACYEYAFRHACANGHLDVAQWLYNVRPIQVHCIKNCALFWAKNNGHLHIVKWLISLNSPAVLDDEH